MRVSPHAKGVQRAPPFRLVPTAAPHDPDAPPASAAEEQPVRPVRTQTNAPLFGPLLINENIILVEWSPLPPRRGGEGAPLSLAAL